MRAEAEIAEAGAEQDGQRHIGDGVDQHGTAGIGQDVAQQNARHGIAEHAAGGDIVGLALHQHLRPHQLGVRHPADAGDGDVDVDQARPEHGDEENHQHQEREGHHQIDQPAKDRVDPATVPADQQPDQAADEQREDHAGQRDLQIDAGGMQGAGQNIAAELVGAEGVCGGRRSGQGGEVERQRIIRRQPVRHGGGQQHRAEQYQAEQQRRGQAGH